ncbi:hypothetical protein JA33_248 [Dickeya phage vB_DsoM_JA33]|uniref:Uncharacterized protein n=3 Tax=Salmondvirus JA11 TaxID=2734141 RepID=A0A384ZWN9_9CAUD|nr:hypothetical protein HOU32_gp247 [Dickeya phage vB_DsoM_JA11]AXG66651.1 hypothetical protein JA13_248 [Dickeya phage vB_DsoM_JA13]AXG67622.1 hypothetical protein JA33_248 [Dickeya phage vB_DsoM_JA33]AYD80052.1 hypothetical protein JA11_247 [Dickeya phage vB_DsoM_JA11]
MTTLTPLDRKNVQTVLTVLFEEKESERKRKNLRVSTRQFLKLAHIPSVRKTEALDMIKTVSRSAKFRSTFGKWIMTIDQANRDSILFMQP